MNHKIQKTVAYNKLTLRSGYYNHTHRQVANLFNKVILCVQRHVTMFVQRIMNI